MSSLSTIWENTGGSAEQYICASALYLMSVMFQCYSVIIDCGISSPGHGKEVVNDINAIDKCYIYQLISNVKLQVSKLFDSRAFDEIHQVVLGRISDNMASLFRYCKYGQLTQMAQQQIDFILLSLYQRHIRYKIIQQLTETLFLRVN